MMRTRVNFCVQRWRESHRRGIFFVLAAVCLIGAMTFVGLSVDLGMITVTKTRMQAASDAAALAAAQEIVVAVRQASWEAQDGIDMTTVQALAAEAAREMAEKVTAINGFYISPDVDVELGRRILTSTGEGYSDSWGSGPYNMVRVNIRKDNKDPKAPDARLPLVFAGVVGEDSQVLTTSATAFIESRDIVAVLDYSGSMGYDSLLVSSSVSRLGQSAVEASLDDIWNALVGSQVTFSDDSTTVKFPEGGFGGINSYTGNYISSSDVNSVFNTLGLYTPAENYWDDWSYSSYYDYHYTTEYGYNWRKYDSGTLKRRPAGSSSSWTTVNDSAFPGSVNTVEESYVPFPQEGKYSSSGLRKGKPSRSESEDMWKDYISFVMNDSSLNTYGYRKEYNYRTLMHYLIRSRGLNSQSEDLWRAPVQPFHAMKEGMTLFTEFMDDLSYGDQIGLVTYASTSRIEEGLWDDGADATVDLGGDELTVNYDAINTIQFHKQPGHYDRNTGIGDGIADALELLEEEGRYGAQKAILLMTDGQPNVYPSGFGEGSLPNGWDWSEMTDYDGDGTADFEIDSSYSGWNSNWQAALYTFYQAKLAADQGIVIHTLSVGAGADTGLMDAIAHMSGGYSMHVPGGSSAIEMEEQLKEAFAVMAGNVPPARLLIDED